MSGERFDYSNERQRHEKFVGREALLARLDALLVDDGADRWVVVTGGPGMGKSTILSAWLARREAAGAEVPHHFIRRGAYDWDDPAQLVGSLVAQLDESFPGAREPDPGARMHPAARLAKALARVSEQELGPRSERLVVLIDGLDEYDPPAGALPGDPLAAFLPLALPRGVSFLCASRPRHPYVSSLEARDGDFIQLDLDASDSSADNDATVRMFWESAAGPLALGARFVKEAVARAGGNVQHAVQLRRHVAATPAQLRRIEDIPRGLGVLIERTWERIAHDAVVVEGLGIRRTAAIRSTLDWALISCPGSGHTNGGMSSRRTPPGRSRFQPAEIVYTGTWHGTCSACGACLPSTMPMPLRPRRVAMPAASLKTPCSMASCRTISQRCSTPRAIARNTASAIHGSSSASSTCSSPVACYAMASSASGVTRVPRSAWSRSRARPADSALRARVVE